MEHSSYAIPAAVLVTVVSELLLWTMFQKKMEPLSFPHELDTSYFRFFSLDRLRIVAIGHTIVMLICASLFYFFVW